MDLLLDGKRALVTGSYRGTGLIIAQRLLSESVRVYVHGFTREQAQAAVTELGAGDPVHGDLTTDAGAEALLAQTPDVDILVNNYGVAERGTWADSDTDAWLDLYQKNVLSAQRMIRGLLPRMRATNTGRIINLGTVGSTRPNARMPHYYAAKGALATLTVSLAKEVAGTGIRVNLVSPGLILTPEVKAQQLERAARKGWGERWEDIEPRVAADTLTKRIPRRQEVADLVVFLASPLADAIHAQNIRVDGGALDIVS